MQSLFSLTMAMVLPQDNKPTPQPPTVPYQYWESNSVLSNGIRLHYWRTGGLGKPVMILAHGITDYGLNWATLASKFEGDYDIIMYDARGHGFSEKPTGPYDLATHVEDLVGLIRALEIKKPILIGHSMGGSIVGMTGATYPDLPRAVIMEDPPIEEMLDQLADNVIHDWHTGIGSQSRLSKAELINLARTERHPGWPDLEYDHWAESKRLVVPQVVDILEDSEFGNPREFFTKITAPTLLLKADVEEKYRQRHHTAAQCLPNGLCIHIDGTGHVMRNDKTAEVERTIRSFLSELKPD